MKYTELVSEVSKKANVKQDTADEVIKALRDTVVEVTTKEEEEEVRISGFGKFVQKHIKPKKNATVGKHTGLDIPGKRYPRFKCFDSAKKEY